MSVETEVLRAMLRVARRCEGADEAALAARVGGSKGVVRAAIRRLDSQVAPVWSGGDSALPRLTMAGSSPWPWRSLLPPQVKKKAHPSRRPSRAA